MKLNTHDQNAAGHTAVAHREIANVFDFIVCGAGSSGSVVAARLAEDGNASVLLLEAGGDDMAEAVMNPAQWPLNLGSSRDWGFVGQPAPGLDGRRLPLSMGKGLGGGSSINVMVWARGHKGDWDHFAAESGDDAWGYQSILGYYRRIEDWRGTPDPTRRGVGGPAYVAQPQAPQPVAEALLRAASTIGIPVYDTPNGEMMEGPGGASIAELRIRDGKRESVFGSYIRPLLSQPNLTVVTDAMVTRLLFDGQRVKGVEALVDGQRRQFTARCETVLSLGAINTPKVLMQSGIGPEDELHAHGIPVVQHLPGVGRNHQDHLAFGCTWAYRKPEAIGGSGCEAKLYWKSDTRLAQPDILQCQLEFAVPSPIETGLETPKHGWTMFNGLAQPKSRGRLRLSGPNTNDPILIEPNSLSEPEDMAAALAAVELCRELGNSEAFTSGRSGAPSAISSRRPRLMSVPKGACRMRSFRLLVVQHFKECRSMLERQALMSFAALSQETRLHIVRMLVVAGPDGMAAGAVAEKAGVSPSNVSFHLKELERAGLINQQRESRSIIYTANYDGLGALIRFLMEDCCAGHPEICAPAAEVAACCSPSSQEALQ